MYFALLKNHDFVKIWLAQLTSQLANNLLNFALIIRVYELAANTNYASIAVSLLILAFGLPSIIFAVVAGAYVDHWDRKKVLIITNVARAILVLGFLFVESNLLLVYLLVFAVAVFSQFFTPAEGAALPRIVKKSELLSANSLFLFTLYGSFVVGYSLAGPVIAAWGSNAVYWLTAAAFAFAAILCISLPELRVNTTKLKIAEVNKLVLKTIRQSFAQILRTKKLIFPIANLTIAQALLGVIAVLAPAIAFVVFGQSLTQVSYKLIVPAAVGMLVGAVVVGQFLRNVSKVRIIDIGILMATVTLLGLSYVPVLKEFDQFGLLVACIAFLLGFSNGIVSVSAQTLLQLNSTDETRGKIFGSLNMMINIAAILPVFLAGFTADLVSPLTVLTGAGVLVGVYGVYQHFAFSKLHLKDS